MPTRKPATEGRAQGGHLHYTAARARLSEAATARRPSPLLENFSPFARTAELGLGGFREWQRHQERRARARGFLSEAEEVGAEVGQEEPLTDRVAEMMTLALLEELEEAMEME